MDSEINFNKDVLKLRMTYTIIIINDAKLPLILLTLGTTFAAVHYLVFYLMVSRPWIPAIPETSQMRCWPFTKEYAIFLKV